MAGLMAEEGLETRNPVLHKKVKFTVSVRGRYWSSARYVQETVEEFARVTQRNARRLEFIGEHDQIQRLQLAKADGSEPEELDVDATLEDVIICMGDKHLVAIITPSESPVQCSCRREPEKLGMYATRASGVQNDGIPKFQLQYHLGNSPLVRPVTKKASGSPGLKPVPVLFKRRVASKEASLLRRLEITIPSSNLTPAAAAIYDERGRVANDFERNDDAFTPQPHSNRLDEADVPKTPSPLTLTSPKTTPSPAELAHFLVKGSSLPPCRSGPTLHDSGNAFCSQYLGNPTPGPGFHTLATAFLRRFPVLHPSSNTVCIPPTDNIVRLANFLASRLRSEPDYTRVSQCPPVSPYKKIVSTSDSEYVPNSEPAETHGSEATAQKSLEGSVVSSLCGQSPGVDKASVSGSKEKEEKDMSSPPDVIITSASSSTSESTRSRSELIFFVNRRSKKGLGAHHLKLSDLSLYFHLSVVDAAKKLGVSQTTLKKACRRFGLKRWPGRKVRSLESTIHGLERTIAIGQQAGMEQLTEAYIRSEVKKLQQEMDQLVHGTVAQHLPVTRRGDFYKRLHSGGWKSKHQTPFNLDVHHDDVAQMLSSTGKNDNEGIKELGVIKSDQDSRSIVQQLVCACNCKDHPYDSNWSYKCHLGRSKITKRHFIIT